MIKLRVQGLRTSALETLGLFDCDLILIPCFYIVGTLNTSSYRGHDQTAVNQSSDLVIISQATKLSDPYLVMTLTDITSIYGQNNV